MDRTYVRELDTPSLVVELDVMEANIARMASLAREQRVALRPHIKTHKSPWIAKKQLEAGAVGITVAKLGEAEVMVAGGVRDVLVAFPLVGRAKLERLERLALEADLAVSLDAIEVAEGLSAVGERLGTKIPIYLEIDTGLGRVGVQSGSHAVGLARRVAALPGLELRGVMTHGGHVGAEESVGALERASRRQASDLVATANAIREAGMPVEVVSPGSTLAAPFEADTEGVTEIRPGTYVFNDANTVARWSATENTCAAFILATVVSRSAKDRAVIDAGSKTLGADARVGGGPGIGIVRGRTDVIVERTSEEHGTLRVDPTSDLKIGDRIEVIPNHICPVVNLSDVLIGTRNGHIEMEIPVAARGRRQ